MANEHLRILLVEDNLLDARLVREVLAERPEAVAFELHQALRLQEATERLARADIDIVLLDLSLPDGLGVENVARVRERAPRIPIVILTGLDDSEIATRAMQEGAQDYLVKGRFDGEGLVRAMRYAVERKRADESALRLAFEQASRADAEAAARRARFLAETSRVLAASLDYEAILQTVARLAVPTLSDCCVVDVLDESKELQRVAVAHADPELQALADRLRLYPPDPRSQTHPAVLAVRSGEKVEVPNLGRELEAERGPEYNELLDALRPRSVMSLPMKARGRILGVISFASQRPRDDADPELGALAEELVARAALAVDNARLYREAQQVVAVVSHDLRNPLSVILMNAAVLRRELEPAGRSHLQASAIERSARRMNRLIEDLLDITRIDADHLPLVVGDHELSHLAADALELVRHQAIEKNIQLDATYPGAGAATHCDRERVLQVLSNLLGNAVKFTPDGGKVRLVLDVDGNEVRCSVRDSGPGIPLVDQPRIFDRFWTGSGTDRNGTGLGLSIARGIVIAHGGRIWVESKPGEGCTFAFTLPRAPDLEHEGDEAPREGRQAG